MFSLAKSLALFALFSSAVVAQPYSVRDAHRHHAIAARHAAAEPAVVPAAPVADFVPQARTPVASSKRMTRKARRSTNGRCKPRTSAVASSTAAVASSSAAVVSSSTAAVASSSAAVVSSTPAAAPTIVNVGADPSISSSAPAAAPTTTEAPAPTTTDTPAPAPTTTDTPAPAPATSTTEQPATTTSTADGSVPASAPSFLKGTQTGQGTFYATGLGACGITNTDTDFIAAASHLLFDTFPGYNGVNPNNNPICNLKVTATYQGKSVSVAITDRCEACAITDLDFSPSAFDTLADPSVGRLSGMTWVWDDLSSVLSLL